MNLYVFYSLITISLSLFFFIILFSIFSFKKSLKKKEINSKIFFNKLELIDFKLKLEIIFIISIFNNSFEPLIDMSYEFQEEYKKKLMIVKQNIFFMNELNSSYDILNSKKIWKKINKDLNLLSKELNDHDKKLNLSKELYEKFSDISIEYVEIKKDILIFYEKHIMSKYDNNFFLSKINNLNNNLDDLSEIKKNFDINAFFIIMYEINKILKEIISMCTLWYRMDKICSYIKSNIDEIDSKLINDSKSTINSVSVERKLSIIKKKYWNIQTELKYASFEEVQDDIKDCILSIQDINSDINYTISTDIFHSEYFDFINRYLNKISKEKESITNSLLEIRTNFKSSEKINYQINDIIKITRELDEKKRLLKSDNFSKKNNNKYINFTIQTINCLYTWLISIDTLIKSIEDKYSNFSFLVKEISNFKFSISKIIGSIYEYNIMDHTIIQKLTNSFDHISKIEQKINDNYRYAFNQNIADILVDEKIELIEHKNYVEKEIKFKFFSEKLLIYANKYLIDNELFKNKIINAENYYLNKNYKKTIKYLLKELKKVN